MTKARILIIGGASLDTLDGAEDLVAGRTLEVGEPIGASASGEGSSRPVGRSMAIPISSWGLTGGELEVGDEVWMVGLTATERVVSRRTRIARGSGSTRRP